MTVAPVKTWVDDRSGTNLYYIDGNLILGVGGVVPLPSLGSYARGSVIRGGVAQWEAYAAETLGAVLIGDGTDIISDTTPSFVGRVSFAAGITMNGASGANEFVIPDNVAVAFELEDAATEYLRIITDNTARAVVFNEHGEDVDFRVETVGHADALVVQGSDGQVTLGALGLGFVQSTAGGVLSSAAIGVGDLPAHAAEHEVGGGDLVDHNLLTNYDANRHIDHTAVTLTAGAGLTGGGDISANRTFNVVAGDGITVNANDIALTTPGTLTATTGNAAAGNHTHAITSSSNPGAAAAILATSGAGALTLTGVLNLNSVGAVLQAGAVFDCAGVNNALVLDNDGDTSIGANVDDNIAFTIAGTDDFTMTANAFNVLSGSAIVMADGATIGQAAGPLITFDDAGDDLEITGCNVSIGNAIAPTAKLQIDDTVHFLRFYETDGTANKRMYGWAATTDDLHLTARSDAGALTRNIVSYQHDGLVFIGPTPSYGAQLTVDQSSSSATIPVLAVDQADISEGFINYIAASAASVANPISTWTTGNSIQGFVRIEINGVFQWMPFYDAPTS